MEIKLLELLACPVCGGKLLYDQCDQRLECRVDHLFFLIQDGVPMMNIKNAMRTQEG